MKTLHPETPLEKVVAEWLTEYANECWDGEPNALEKACTELLQHGCVSGMVSELIYYTDTVAFYEKHQKEIDALLKELLSSSGLSISELFGEKWDEEDPLAREDMNKNLLAWFGFEETARNLCDREEIEV